MMHEEFWRQRWERNEIAFHEPAANPLLVKHFEALGSSEGGRVFVPMCGKTLDIGWLLSRGFSVAGAELSGIAVGQLFAGLGIEPRISEIGPLSRHSAEGIDIFVGDIFKLTREALGPVDAVYDRAAMVALPEPMRERYAAHLVAITDRAPQLLITFNYDQSMLEGPPFSVGDEEVTRRYGASHDPKLLATPEIPGGFKGCKASEHVWLLNRRAG